MWNINLEMLDVIKHSWGPGLNVAIMGPIYYWLKELIYSFVLMNTCLAKTKNIRFNRETSRIQTDSTLAGQPAAECHGSPRFPWSSHESWKNQMELGTRVKFGRFAELLARDQQQQGRCSVQSKLERRQALVDFPGPPAIHDKWIPSCLSTHDMTWHDMSTPIHPLLAACLSSTFHFYSYSIALSWKEGLQRSNWDWF